MIKKGKNKLIRHGKGREKKVVATFQILVTSALRICSNVLRQTDTKDSPYEMGPDTRTSCLGYNAPLSTVLR